MLRFLFSLVLGGTTLASLKSQPAPIKRELQILTFKYRNYKAKLNYLILNTVAFNLVNENSVFFFFFNLILFSMISYLINLICYSTCL